MPAPNYTLADGPSILANGKPAIKNSPVLHYIQQDASFTITDKSGAIASGVSGDWIGYDPVSGNCFMIRKAYFEANFTLVSA